jgi:hypothetical protein
MPRGQYQRKPRSVAVIDIKELRRAAAEIKPEPMKLYDSQGTEVFIAYTRVLNGDLVSIAICNSEGQVLQPIWIRS